MNVGCEELLGALLAILVIAIIKSWIVMLLWNALFPTLFGFTTITYWQSFGLNIICGLLFKPIFNNNK